MSFDINLDTSKAIGKVKVLNGHLDGISARIKKLNTEGIALGRVGASAASLKSQTAVGALGLQNITRSVSQLSAQVSTANVGITQVGKQVTALGAKAKVATRSLSPLRAEMAQTSKEAAALRAGMYATGTHFGAFTAQTLLAATATYAFVRSIAAVISVGAEFETKMARANAVMGNFTKGGELIAENAKMLGDEVRRLGETTVFTVSEVADGLVFLGMAGLNTAEAAKALAPVLNLASIGMLDMAKAADIATNIMLGFDKEAADLAGIVDVMAVAVTSSNMNIVQLGNSLSYVAPIAEATNNSLVDTVAILEIFHDVGIKSSRAGTSLRRALINLSKPTEKVQGILNKLNVSLYDQENRMRPLIHIMRQFRDANASTADILTIFGARAGPALLKFYTEVQKEVNGSTGAFKENKEELLAASNAAEVLRERIEDVLSADWKKLISALSKVAEKIFEDIGPGLREAVQGVTEFIKAIDTDKVILFAGGLAAVVVGVHAVIPLLGTLAVTAVTSATAIVSATTAMGGFAAILAVVTGPLGWAAAAAGLAAYFILQEDSTEATKESTKAIRSEVDAAADLAKVKRDLGDLNLQELRTKEALTRSNLAKAQAGVTLGESTEATLNRTINKLWNDRLALMKRATNLTDFTIKDRNDAVAANVFLTNSAKSSLEIVKDQNKESREYVKTVEKQLGIEKGILDVRNESAEAIQKQKRAMVSTTLAAAPVSHTTVIAQAKEVSQARIDEINLREKLGELTKNQARLERDLIRDLETSSVIPDLQERIRLQDIITTKAASALAAHGRGTAGLGDTPALIKQYNEEREALEKLVKALSKYIRASDKKAAVDEAAARASGRAVDDSLSNIWVKESDNYADRLDALKAFYTEAGTLNKAYYAQAADLTLRHGANQVANTAQYMGSIINNLAQSTSIRYQMSRQEAEDSYTLWQTAIERQADFQEAANHALTAGDQRYYQNLSDQYENYAAIYKKQFEERDVLARKNFESNKRMQIAQAKINTIAGAAMTIGQLGYWGIPIAASILRSGNDMVSQIKAQEYQSPGSDITTGAFGGLAASPEDSAAGAVGGGAPLSDVPTGGSLIINIEGGIINEEFLYNEFIPTLQSAVEDRDIVLIKNDTRNGEELRNS